MEGQRKDKDDRGGETHGAPGPTGPFGPIEHHPEVVRQHVNDCSIQLLEGQVSALAQTVTAMEARLLQLEAMAAAPREPTQDRADEARRANKARRKRCQRQRRADRREREWLASQRAGRRQQEWLESQAAPHK